MLRVDCAQRASRQITRIVSSPAMRANDIRQPGAIDRQAEQLRLPGPGLDDDQLLRRVDAQQKLAERPRQRDHGGRGRAGISPRRRPDRRRPTTRFTRPSSLISRESVACVTTNPMRREPLPQLFLAVHGFALDELANRGQPACFHIYAFSESVYKKSASLSSAKCIDRTLNVNV